MHIGVVNAAVAPTVNEFYKKYGCNAYDVIVLSVEYEGTTQQTVDFENANGGDQLSHSVSGLDGGGGTFNLWSSCIPNYIFSWS